MDLHELQIDRRKITYVEWGNKSNPVLLCVHGLSRNAHDFNDLAAFLKDEYRIISVNLAGHGSSDYLSDYRLYKYDLFTDDILKLLDNLCICSVSWIGTSLGGIIAMYASKNRPDLISKMILNDIGPQLSSTSLPFLQNIDIDLIRPYYTFDSIETCRAAFTKMTAGFKFPTKEYIERAWQHGFYRNDAGGYSLNFDVGVLSTLVNTGNIIRDPGLWDIWEAIDIPILELWGARSPLLTSEIISKMKSTNKNLMVCKSLSNGHTCNLIDIEQLEFIRSWLKYPKIGEEIVIS